MPTLKSLIQTPYQGILFLASVTLSFAQLHAAQVETTALRAGRSQELQRQLENEDAFVLARDARRSGNPVRGAVLFFQPQLACARCHDAAGSSSPLGPDLTKIGRELKDEQFVESILQPSRLIKQGFESVVLLTKDGRSVTGIVADENVEVLVLRDASQDGKVTVIPKDQIEERLASKQSIMPEGLAAGLASRQEFLDLVRYLMEIAEHGTDRARQLRPAGAFTTLRLPAYEQNIDHAGILQTLDDESLRRGKEIFEILCVNCHGTESRPGTLPTSLRFAADKFKNGSDSYSMYRTLTYGFGLMLPQTWMVPQQKYDVIHYIREQYLKEYNPSQYHPISASYLHSLPRGTDRGPKPVRFEPWLTMDYGPSLIHTYELPTGVAATGRKSDLGDEEAARNTGATTGTGVPANIAYKGIAIRLDAGSGGVARGNNWIVFDHDTLRTAGAWSRKSDTAAFIDWEGIMFNGRHAVHPQVVGRVHFANPIGPGWANPVDGSFADPRLRGRDGRPYGPLPRDWAHYNGLYHFGSQVVLSYSVGNVRVLELPGLAVTPISKSSVKTTGRADPSAKVQSRNTNTVGSLEEIGANDPFLFTRTFNIGPRDHDMVLQVAQAHSRTPKPPRVLKTKGPSGSPPSWIVFGRDDPARVGNPREQGIEDAGLIAAGVVPAVPGTRWLTADGGHLRLQIAAGKEPLRFTVWVAEIDSIDSTESIDPIAVVDHPSMDLTPLTRGGPVRWPTTLTTTTKPSGSDGPFAIDMLSHPVDNPWFCRTRFTGFDFFPDGDSAAICDWDGDVWLVSGLLGNATRLEPDPSEPTLRWQRIASGLFQPLGLKIIEGQIYVTCRDQIVILHDLNGDRETDYYENFNNDHQVTEHFHEFAMGLQTDGAGNLYYAKSARHALPALVPHHGTLLRVSKDGSRTDILANGFRAANGVCLNPDGSFIVTDQEGHWNPKNRINWVTVNPDGSPKFYGNMFGYHDVTDPSDAAMEQPLCWITNAFDRSPAELLWVTSERWGPLRGSLLNLSYGYGNVYVVPHEEVAGQMQGGMCELPITPFRTGVMRGRFHPGDGQLYLCGMFAWAGNAIEPGGFYRVRWTGKPMHLPTRLESHRGGIAITFTESLDRLAATDPVNYSLKTWSLRRSAQYGSEHHHERPLEVSGVRLSGDERTAFLEIPQLEPAQCMSIEYRLRAAGGDRPPFSGLIHNTIHALRP